MNTKEFFLSLASSITEAQVKQLLDNYAYTQNSSNWMPLGKNRNNAAMVQNTAGSLGSCMTELATNAIDAVIQREKNRLDADGIIIPDSALNSPQNFLEFALGDDYTDMKKRELFAHKNIKFLTTESGDGKRMLTVIDQGCGQRAENFGDTFCSVGAGQNNKANKNWLHGNYGQGSTSANAISGKYGYKMIVSRENANQKWGFTLIRRSPSDPSMLEYLISGDSVLEFDADKIEMGIRVTGVLEKGEASLTHGSAIKLFDVKFDTGFTGIKRTMGIVLFRPALPIKSIEFSHANEKGKSKGRDSRWLYGQGYEFDKMVLENKAVEHQFSFHTPELGTAYGRMFFIQKQAHLKEILDWYPNNYLERTKRIFHINNGQVQHTDQNNKIGRYFPKAQEHVFVEIDLSFFDKNMAKAYMWKADRTACQTSNEFFQIYDSLLNEFFEHSDVLRSWALICNEEQMSKLKVGNSKMDDSMKTAVELWNTRESKQYKANKQLVERSPSGLYAGGKLSLASNNPDENADKTQFEGREIPTLLSSSHNTKTTAKKASVKKMAVILQTDIKKGAITSHNGNAKIKVIGATLKSQQGESDINPENLTTFMEESEGKINFQLTPNATLKAALNVGDSIAIKVALTTDKDSHTYILEETVYFDIVEQLKDVAKPKMRNQGLQDIFKKQYGTKNGRIYNNVPTATLEATEGGFSFDAGYYIYHNDGELFIYINLDNPKFQAKRNAYKQEDQINFMKYWEISLITKVMSKYHYQKNKGQNDLEALANSLNDTEDAAWLNDDCLQNAACHMKEAEKLFSQVNKKMVA